MNLKVNLNKFIKYFLILMTFLLPIQSVLHIVFKLPAYIQFFYLFLIIGTGICCCYKKNILAKLDLNFIFIFFLFLISALLSIIINFEEVVSRGMEFTYYVRIYSNFWDSPKIRMFAWGVMRPSFFLLYCSILMVLLKINNNYNNFIKTIIILGFISSVYAHYQLLAHFFNLPYGSFFAGADRPPIMFFGNIRRCEGLFYEPGPHAAVLSPIFCILTTQLFEKNNFKLFFPPLYTKIMWGFITSALALTFSPIGFLTPPLFLFFYTLLNIRKIFNKKFFNFNFLIKLASIVLIAIIVTFSFTKFLEKNIFKNFSLSKHMIEKFATSTTDLESPLVYSNPDSRSVRNYVGISLFKDNKIFGAGPSSAISYFFKYAYFSNMNIQLRDQNAVLNNHIKILCEYGIVGFIIYLMILFYPFYLYLKNKKKLLNTNFIISLLIGHLLYLLLSFQAVLHFYQIHFWMIYVATIVAIQLDLNKNMNKIQLKDNTTK